MFKENNLKKYVDILPASISKDDLTTTIDEIEKNTKVLKSSFSTFSEYFEGGKRELLSDIAIELNSRVKAVLKVDGVVRAIDLGIKNVDARLKELESAIKKHMEDDNPKTLLTYEKVSLVKLLDLLLFWTEYSVSIMRYIAINEISEVTSQKPTYAQSFVNKIVDGFPGWISITEIIINERNLDKTIDKISSVDIVVRDHVSNVNDKSKDPLKLNLLGTPFNVFYLFSDMIADIYIARYKYLNEQAADLRAHLEYLSSIDENGEGNPKILASIEKISTRLKKIEYLIKKKEEETFS